MGPLARSQIHKCLEHMSKQELTHSDCKNCNFCKVWELIYDSSFFFFFCEFPSDAIGWSFKLNFYALMKFLIFWLSDEVSWTFLTLWSLQNYTNCHPQPPSLGMPICGLLELYLKHYTSGTVQHPHRTYMCHFALLKCNDRYSMNF